MVELHGGSPREFPRGTETEEDEQREHIWESEHYIFAVSKGKI